MLSRENQFQVGMPPLPSMVPPPTLEVFYSSSCAPCRAELPVLAEFASKDGARVRIIILSEEARARRELHAVSPLLEAAAESRIEKSPGTVLRSAGNSLGILPYARSTAANGDVCARWKGWLTLARARDLMSACARLIASPAPP